MHASTREPKVISSLYRNASAQKRKKVDERPKKQRLRRMSGPKDGNRPYSRERLAPDSTYPKHIKNEVHMPDTRSVCIARRGNLFGVVAADD